MEHISATHATHSYLIVTPAPLPKSASPATTPTMQYQQPELALCVPFLCPLAIYVVPIPAVHIALVVGSFWIRLDAPRSLGVSQSVPGMPYLITARLVTPSTSTLFLSLAGVSVFRGG